MLAPCVLWPHPSALLSDTISVSCGIPVLPHDLSLALPLPTGRGWAGHAGAVGASASAPSAVHGGAHGRILGALLPASLRPGILSETCPIPRAFRVFLHHHLSCSPKHLQVRGTRSQPADQSIGKHSAPRCCPCRHLLLSHPLLAPLCCGTAHRHSRGAQSSLLRMVSSFPPTAGCRHLASPKGCRGFSVEQPEWYGH